MLKAQDYSNMYKRLIDSDISAYWVTEKDFKKAINEARREAIKEAAKRVDEWSEDVIKSSVLSLLHEIK